MCSTHQEKILRHIDKPIFHLVGQVADSMQRPCYVVGGYVRDIFLNRTSNDIDFVTVGSGIEVAKAVADKIGRKNSSLAVFKTYGTAQVKAFGLELEFVGARRESYRHQLLKTEPFRMTSNDATSRSMLWRYRSTPTTSANCSTPSMGLEI